ncbi:MAG: nucleotide exchange factor GrpE [Pseudomonadales bacterium]
MSEKDQPQQQNESTTDGVDQPDSVDTEDQAEDTVTADETAQAESSAPQGEADDEVARLKDQVLRSLAEVENIKRRSARDVENAHKFAVEKLLSDLLPVIDSLEKAVETASATEGAEPIAEGVELSLKLFIDTLAKSGVEQIDPLGAPFDPQEHEAMTMVPNPDAEPNSVMDVMAKGYRLNGRLVRAAKVIVVKAD